ncbi:hypothetical protein BN439_1043 [Erwinia amylovora Ea644]|nr:hypothetical protein BN439_1043 [Erwinia amylovora Ea644]CCP06159.1 hypothetical protein BN440_1110 [Erwinia amylovora MR1]
MFNVKKIRTVVLVKSAAVARLTHYSNGFVE